MVLLGVFLRQVRPPIKSFALGMKLADSGQKSRLASRVRTSELAPSLSTTQRPYSTGLGRSYVPRRRAKRKMSLVQKSASGL